MFKITPQFFRFFVRMHQWRTFVFLSVLPSFSSGKLLLTIRTMKHRKNCSVYTIPLIAHFFFPGRQALFTVTGRAPGLDKAARHFV